MSSASTPFSVKHSAQRGAASRESFCVVCNENPRFASLTRCRSCLRSQTESDLEAQRLHREHCAARAEAEAANRGTYRCCRTCRERKPLVDFAPHARGLCGRRRDCRACVTLRASGPTKVHPITRLIRPSVSDLFSSRKGPALSLKLPKFEAFRTQTVRLGVPPLVSTGDTQWPAKRCFFPSWHLPSLPRSAPRTSQRKTRLGLWQRSRLSRA